MSTFLVQPSGGVATPDEIRDRAALLPTTQRHAPPLMGASAVVRFEQPIPIGNSAVLLGPQIEAFKDDPASPLPGNRWMYTHQVGACYIRTLVGPQDEPLDALMRLQLVGIFFGVEAVADEYEWLFQSQDSDWVRQPRALSRPWTQANVWFLRLIVRPAPQQQLPSFVRMAANWSITVSSPTR